MTSAEKLGIMQPGPPGTHRMVLDFSSIILGFEAMHSDVERAENMVPSKFRCCSIAFVDDTLVAAGIRNEGQDGST